MRNRAALGIVAAVALAACGGGTATTAPASAPATETAAPSMAVSEAPSVVPSAAPSVGGPSELAAPSGSPLDLGSASSGVSNLDAYQMNITVASGTDTQSLTVEATKKPVEATHYILEGDQTLEFISIKGQGAWMKQGKSWVSVPGGANAMMSLFDALAPDTLISAYSLGKFGDTLSYVDITDHNGVRAAHYHLDAGLAAKLNAVGFPADGAFDAWVAVDGGYLVGMQYGATNPATGKHADVTIDVTHVNDPGIVIEAPTQG
jgi:hypothetical protein